MSLGEPIDVGGRFTIPDSELSWRFTTSGGPGGQHANRSATRAELSWDIAGSESVPDDLRARIERRLGGRARGGIVTVTVDDTRSQWQNRALARRRLAQILADAATDEPVRTPTRPSSATRRRRLEAKRLRARTKELRKKPETE
jgi:ribosome-associated protein